MQSALSTFWLWLATLLSSTGETPEIGGTQPPAGPPR